MLFLIASIFARIRINTGSFKEVLVLPLSWQKKKENCEPFSPS